MYSIDKIQGEPRENGSLSHLRLSVADNEKAIPFPWVQVDEDLGALVPDVPVLVISFSNLDPHGRASLMKLISRSMTHMKRAGKLKFELYDCHRSRNRLIAPILVDALDEGDDSGEGENGGGNEDA